MLSLTLKMEGKGPKNADGLGNGNAPKLTACQKTGISGLYLQLIEFCQ